MIDAMKKYTLEQLRAQVGVLGVSPDGSSVLCRGAKWFYRNADGTYSAQRKVHNPD